MWRVRLIEYCCDKYVFSKSSTLLDIIRVIRISSFSVQIRRVECRCDKFIFSTNYRLSTLLDIIHVVTTSSFSVQIRGVYVWSSAVVIDLFSVRGRSARWGLVCILPREVSNVRSSLLPDQDTARAVIENAMGMHDRVPFTARVHMIEYHLWQVQF